MSWSFNGATFPAPNGSDDSAWAYWAMVPLAIRERQAVIEGPSTGTWNWPPPDQPVWTQFTISTITDNGSGDYTITLTATDPIWDEKNWQTGTYTYTQCSGGTPITVGINYDLIIQSDVTDPFTAIRCQITAETYTGPVPAAATLTVSSLGSGTQGTYDLATAVAAGFVTSVASLAGATAYIIYRGYHWVTDRLIDKPNQRELWYGSDSLGNAAFTLAVTATGGTGALTYTWSCTPPTGGGVQYSKNGITGAATTLALVTTVGVYTFTVTVTDTLGKRAYSVAAVTVSRSGGGISISYTNPTPPTPDSGAATISTPASATYSNGLFPWVASGDLSTLYSTITDLSGAPQGTVTNPWVQTKAWTVDQFKNKQVLVFGSDGILHRETIAHNSAGTGGGIGSLTSGAATVYFTATTSVITGSAYVPGGNYDLVAVGQKAIPGREGWLWRQFYNGYPASGPAVMADLSVGSWPIPAANEDNVYGDCSGGDDSECVGYAVDFFDNDFQVATDNVCSLTLRGKYLAVNFWKSIRSWQLVIPGMSFGFVPLPVYPATNYDGQTAIPTYNPATLFQAAGVNGGTSTLVYVSGTNYTFSVDTIYDTYPIYYAIINADGTTENSSYIVIPSGGVCTVGGASGGSDAGKQVQWSAGWSRFTPRHFQYLFPRSGWIADDVTNDSGSMVYDPPQALTTPGTPANAVEALPFVDSAGAGTFTLTIESTTTAAIVYSAVPATLNAAMNTALGTTFGTTMGTSNIVASGSSLSAIILTFSGGTYADRPIADSTNGTVSGVKVIATLLAGATGFVVGNDPPSTGVGPTLAGGSTTDVVGSPGTDVYIDPATGDSGVGEWNYRGVSTNYLRYDGPNATLQAGVPFVEGDYARYMGDNPADPSIHGTGDTNLYPYYAKLARQQLNPTMQAARVLSRTGTIAKGTPDSFTTFSQNWWADDTGNSSSPLVTQVMTATGGGTTSFLDSSLDPSSNAVPEYAWWNPDRFIGSGFQVSGTTNPFLTFALEVDKVFTHTDLVVNATNNLIVSSSSRPFITADVTDPAKTGTLVISATTGWTAGTYQVLSVDSSGNATLNASPAAVGATGGHYTLTTTFERMITATTASSTVAVDFNSQTGLTVASGDAGRIKEPKYQLNKWQGMLCQIQRSDGTSFYRTCLASSNQTFYFNPSETNPMDQSSSLGQTPLAGWTFTIREPDFGSVWKWNGTAWVDPGGESDTIRLGVPSNPQKFLKSADGGVTPNTGNLETYTLGYGPMYRMDAIVSETANELYAVLNLMAWTKQTVTWTANAVPGTPEVNNYSLDGSPPIAGWGSYYNPPDTPFPNQTAAGAAYVSRLNSAALDASDPVDGPLTTENGMPLKNCSYVSQYTWPLTGPPTGGSVEGGGDIAYNQTGYAHVTVETLISSSIDFYCITDQGDTLNVVSPAYDPSVGVYSLNTFDDQGDSVLSQQWSTWSTESPGTDGEATSARLGNPAVVDMTQTVQWPTTSPYTGGYPYETQLFVTNGYTVTDSCAIVKWQFQFLG